MANLLMMMKRFYSSNFYIKRMNFGFGLDSVDLMVNDINSSVSKFSKNYKNSMKSANSNSLKVGSTMLNFNNNSGISSHGDIYVSSLNFEVDNMEEFYKNISSKFPKIKSIPKYDSISDSWSFTIKSPIKDLSHTFKTINKPYNKPKFEISNSISQIDHCAIVVRQGELEKTANWYNYIGFKHFKESDDISVDSESYGGMKTMIMIEPESRKFNELPFKIVLVEPVPERGIKNTNNQIYEFLKYHNGPGVQHLAFLTNSIFDDINAFKQRNIEFIDIPDAYYDLLNNSKGELDDIIDNLKKYRVLIDRPKDGLLLQTFTKPLLENPTLFLELIERRNAFGFGKGNVTALFHATERQRQIDRINK